MPPKGAELKTPWVRSQLVEWLTKLSDPEGQEGNWVRSPQGSDRLDEMLDFFDDSGVLEEPSGRLGYVLADSDEVLSMASLNTALDAAISESATSGAEIVHSQAWSDVVAAAREALRSLG